MSLASALHSKRWKTIQNYIYSWGASIVLIGALFKLEHLQYSGILLGVGLSIEALIFFISAFEPMMDPPDWKRVYPQLRTGHENDDELKHYTELDEKHLVLGGGGSSSSLSELSEDQIASLNQSLEKIAKTAKGIKDVSEVATATDNFVNNINEANSSITQIIDSNKKAAASFDDGLKIISSNYQEASSSIKGTSEEVANKIMSSLGEVTNSNQEVIEKIKESGIKSATDVENVAELLLQEMKSASNELIDSYKKLNTSLGNNLGGLDQNSSAFIQNIEVLNTNLNALNLIYQNQLQGAEVSGKAMNEYAKGVDSIGKLLTVSIDETEKLNKNTKAFNENIEALNNVYGNMLGALNIKK